MKLMIDIWDRIDRLRDLVDMICYIGLFSIGINAVTNYFNKDYILLGYNIIVCMFFILIILSYKKWRKVDLEMGEEDEIDISEDKGRKG